MSGRWRRCRVWAWACWWRWVRQEGWANGRRRRGRGTRVCGWCRFRREAGARAGFGRWERRTRRGSPVAFEGLYARERSAVGCRCRRIPSSGSGTGWRRRAVVGREGTRCWGWRRDARDGEVSFETELSGSAPGWLGDHRVFGEVLAPGALYAAQVLEALRETGSGSPWALEEVEIQRPLVFSEGEVPDGAGGVGSRRAASRW